MRYNCVFLLALCFQDIASFAPPSNGKVSTEVARTSPFATNYETISKEGHLALRKQRHSVANIQTQGLFGLGTPEIAIILVAAAFLVGPEKLGNVVGKLKEDYNDIPDDLKRIPEEFKKGVEVGEISARARNAKQMKAVPDPPSLPEDNEKR